MTHYHPVKLKPTTTYCYPENANKDLLTSTKTPQQPYTKIPTTNHYHPDKIYNYSLPSKITPHRLTTTQKKLKMTHYHSEMTHNDPPPPMKTQNDPLSLIIYQQFINNDILTATKIPQRLTSTQHYPEIPTNNHFHSEIIHKHSLPSEINP